jgi:phenylacetate-CoA ligase
MDMDLHWPLSRSDLARMQSERKRLAFERAKKAPFYKGRLDGIDPDRLDDPEVWSRIPPVTKDELRSISPREFHAQFCIQPPAAAVEYWRSGGSTGRPLLYPRSAEDMQYSLLSFRRGLAVAGATSDDLAHISFPLGVHPVAHLYARAAIQCGVGTVWCGAGTNTPSENQLELIEELRPTLWIGMPSYGLHLGNLAESQGFDLANASVKKIIVAAEPLSHAKRQKLERMWGAEVFDQFGMSEGGLMACEGTARAGLHFWSDLFYCEVVDEATGEPANDGEIGTLVVTPLWNNSMTPFLRWNSGDLVSVRRGDQSGERPESVFPVMRHERRTVGFFKVRGVNINHPELEDLMFFEPEISEFRAEVYNDDRLGLDVLHLLIELKRGASADTANEAIAAKVRRTFQVTPKITVQQPGTIARQFEANVKAPRFIDLRG